MNPIDFSRGYGPADKMYNDFSAYARYYTNLMDKDINKLHNMTNHLLHYHEIRKDDTLNGYGVRIVLFLSGCNHKCVGCHNPQTWDIESGKIFDESAKQKLFELAGRDYIDGITLSGGDPLIPENIISTCYLCEKFKEKYPNKTIWCYTGYKCEDLVLDNLKDIDVLVDGPFIKEKADVKYPFAGSTNQRIIDIKKTIEYGVLTLFNIK